MRKNLYQDITNKDLTLTDDKNLRFTTTLTEFVSQKIENKLLFFKEEWFLDYTLGVPYFEKIFTKNPDINLINTIFIREIRSIDEIEEVIKFETEYDSSLRTFTINFEVKATDETIIESTLEL